MHHFLFFLSSSEYSVSLLLFQSFFENIALSKKTGMAPSLAVEESEETTLEAEGNWMDEEEDVAEEGNAGKGHEQEVSPKCDRFFFFCTCNLIIN